MYGDSLEARVLDKAAPPAPHVKHVHARAQPERLDRMLHLPSHGAVERIALAQIETVRVAAPAPEPGEKELCGSVVVERDGVPFVPEAIRQDLAQTERDLLEEACVQGKIPGCLQGLDEIPQDVDPSFEEGLGKAEMVTPQERTERVPGVEDDASGVGARSAAKRGESRCFNAKVCLEPRETARQSANVLTTRPP